MVNNKDKRDTNIALIGFMATGKTTIAKELSKSLGIRFVDIDKLIEEKMEISIPEIFEKHGEEYFRQIEKETIEDISKSQNTIISCGGGVCLDPENIINIRKSGKVVLLEANPETILSRTESDSSRPLLKDKNDVEGIKRIMDERSDSYHKSADIIIDTSGKSIHSVKDEIIRGLNLKV